MEISEIAEKLGFEYEPVPKFGLWYEIWGFHSKDYIFDRFEPETPAARILKNFAVTAWFLVYIAPFGVWLTAVGQIYKSFANWVKRLLGLNKPKIEKQRIS